MEVATFYLDKVLLKNTNQPEYGKGKVRKCVFYQVVFLSPNSHSMKKRYFKQRPVNWDPLGIFQKRFFCFASGPLIPQLWST